MDKKGYEPPNAEASAVHHMLQLAEQGRPVEQVAQFLASWFLSGSLNAADIVDETDAIRERVLNLLLDPLEIWTGLLPGLATDNALTTIGLDYFGKLEQAERNVEEIVNIVGKDRDDVYGDAKAWSIVNELTDYFLREGLIKPRIEFKNSGVPGDQYDVSIIVNPEVRHDEPTDVIKDAYTVEAESVLNLAGDIWKQMDVFDKMGHWPAEELSAWITHVVTNKHWIMTWDQASAIVAMDELKQKLDNISYDIDLDDEYQGILDMMAIQGEEYIIQNRR